jgi:hypothetical protein
MGIDNLDPDDVDTDGDTSEGRSTRQQIEDGVFRLMEEREAERDREFRGPEKAYEIPGELYEKAEKDNDKLTEEERALLLSRGDVVGKALACPDKLTLEEQYEALMWSPPDELHAAIRAATDSALSTPLELYRMARRSRLTTLSHAVKDLIGHRFWVDVETANLRPRMYWRSTPGNGQAMLLLYKLVGIDFAWMAFATTLTLSNTGYEEEPDLPPDQYDPDVPFDLVAAFAALNDRRRPREDAESAEDRPPKKRAVGDPE